jgi:anti-sigma factor RsiW
MIITEILGEAFSWLLMGIGSGGSAAPPRRKHLSTSVSIGALCALVAFILVGVVAGWIAGMLAAGVVLLLAAVASLRNRQDSHTPRG